MNELPTGDPGDRKSLVLETDKVREFYDRFVSNFVLDILPEREIEEILKEARRVLKEGGLIA